jgi:pimeloyl-ACP methyl ester carboxylesterase
LPRLKGKLKVPAFYIGGMHSREAKLARLEFMKKHFPFEFRFTKGSHLFPLENPQVTAETIKQIIFSKAL